jgi:hypothetical protein
MENYLPGDERGFMHFGAPFVKAPFDEAPSCLAGGKGQPCEEAA